MASISPFIVTLVTFFVLLSMNWTYAQVAPKPSKNPCHETKRTTGDGQEGCDGIYVVPKKMCSKCSLKKWDTATGNFFDCRSVFGVTENGCQKQLQKYVQANPCDTKRGTDVPILADRSHPQYAQAVDSTDYFIYSICETCCDCIPMKVKPNQYSQRKALNALIKVDRGNCPAHARADVCKVWPNFRAVVNKSKQKKKLSPDLEPICPDLREWLEDIKSKGGWYNEPEVTITPKVRDFLDNLTDVIGCKSKKTWKTCVRMERNQRRI